MPTGPIFSQHAFIIYNFCVYAYMYHSMWEILYWDYDNEMNVVIARERGKKSMSIVKLDVPLLFVIKLEEAHMADTQTKKGTEITKGFNMQWYHK